jgi:SIR2-like domain
MLMIIFGAGASYDSSPEFAPYYPGGGGYQNFGTPSSSPPSREQWRPPLANQLFHDLYGAFGEIVQKYRKLLPILPHLRRPSKGKTVEEELESWQSEASADAERKRQLFSVRYYLHDLLLKVTHEWLEKTSHVTNYVSLIDQIRHHNTGGEPVCLVTFNYDLLLDDALLSFGYDPRPFEHYFEAHSSLKLFRPHGSVNWSRFVDVPPNTRLTAQQLIEQADSLTLSEDYIVADATDPSIGFDRPIVPAIAIPVQTKTDDTFEWPKSHRDYLEELLPRVTKILLIGWQAREAHFMNMLQQHLPNHGRGVQHILVVGKDNNDGKEVLHRFAADLGQSGYSTNHAHPNGGFNQFVANQDGEVFFRS